MVGRGVSGSQGGGGGIVRGRSTRVAWSMLAVFAVGYLAVPLSFANGNVQREPGF